MAGPSLNRYVRLPPQRVVAETNHTLALGSEAVLVEVDGDGGDLRDEEVEAATVGACTGLHFITLLACSSSSPSSSCAESSAELLPSNYRREGQPHVHTACYAAQYTPTIPQHHQPHRAKKSVSFSTRTPCFRSAAPGVVAPHYVKRWLSLVSRGFLQPQPEVVARLVQRWVDGERSDHLRVFYPKLLSQLAISVHRDENAFGAAGGEQADCVIFTSRTATRNRTASVQQVHSHLN